MKEQNELVNHEPKTWRMPSIFSLFAFLLARLLLSRLTEHVLRECEERSTGRRPSTVLRGGSCCLDGMDLSWGDGMPSRLERKLWRRARNDMQIWAFFWVKFYFLPGHTKLVAVVCSKHQKSGPLYGSSFAILACPPFLSSCSFGGFRLCSMPRTRKT